MKKGKNKTLIIDYFAWDYACIECSPGGSSVGYGRE